MKVRTLLIAALAAAALAPLAAHAGEVTNREGRQESRIYQGTQRGSLTRGEYNRLQRSETRINDQRARDLSRNGGHLTGGEYARLNHEENRLSSRIYVDKHNGVNPRRP